MPYTFKAHPGHPAVAYLVRLHSHLGREGNLMLILGSISQVNYGAAGVGFVPLLSFRALGRRPRENIGD
jgi:hypothetical protein